MLQTLESIKRTVDKVLVVYNYQADGLKIQIYVAGVFQIYSSSSEVREQYFMLAILLVISMLTLGSSERK